MSRLRTLTLRLHDAALDSDLWQAVLGEISSQYNCDGAVIISGHSSKIALPFSHSMADMMSDYHKDGWSSRDIRFRGTKLLIQNGIVIDAEFNSEDTIKSSAYYQEFLRKHNLRYSATIGSAVGEDLWCMPIQRAASRGEFSREDLHELSILSKEFLHAARLSVILGERRSHGVLDGLQSLKKAAILLGSDAQVRAMNNLASNLLGGSLQVRNGTLHFMSAVARNSFSRIFKSLGSLEPRIAKDEISIDIEDPAGTLFKAEIIKISGWEKYAFYDVSAMMTFEAVSLKSREIDYDSLGLSKAEGRLALALCSGRSLRQSAVDFNITYETARTQMRSIFSKTGTNRQAELVSLLLRHK